MASLVAEQSGFLADVCRLIDFIRNSKNFCAVTGGELYRTEEQQKIYVIEGKSKTMNSMHMKRLAIDLNIFEMVGTEIKPVYDKAKLQYIGDYWESLNPKNKWGGNFKSFLDVPHFQRTA